MSVTRAIALAIALVTAGCDSGSAASPSAGPPAEAAPPFDGGADATVDAALVVCPDGIDASFGSIYGLLLAKSCGSTLDGCHDSKSVNNTGITLDYSLDAAAVYQELLGDAGTGQPAENLDHSSVHVLRVAPGDASASMLYIKLAIDSGLDPQYGAGMPYGNPGAVCPQAVSAVADWINAGALQN